MVEKYSSAAMPKTYLDENDLLRKITELKGLEQVKKYRMDLWQRQAKQQCDDRRRESYGGKLQRSSSEALDSSMKSSNIALKDDNNRKPKSLFNIEFCKCHATGHIANYCKNVNAIVWYH
ncbi:hypothetical protein TKK_0007960 [Trichogramma kaykai]